jgi:hypothetical protein
MELGAIGSLLSGGSAIAGMLGLGGNNVPQPYRPPGMDGAANNILGQIAQNNSNNVPAQLMPQYQSTVAGLNNNPGTGQFIQGGTNANYLGNAAAGNAGQGGGYLQMLAHLIGGQAFDPQNALYGRTQQQVQDQTRASSAARGLESTPFGAGVENKANSDFNIDWQNNLLQRMIGGGGAAGNLMNSGVNLSAMAPGLAYQAGQYPYQAFNTIGQNNLNNLDRLAQAGITSQTIPNNSIAQWQNYINTGNSSNQVANQQQQQAFNQNQIYGNQLGSAVNGFQKAGGMNTISNAFGGSSPQASPTYYSGTTTGTGWG